MKKFKTLDHVNKLYSFNFIYVLILNTLSQFTHTIMYVVKSEFVLTRYVNPVWTNYVISYLKHVVKLIEHINEHDRWRYSELYYRAWLSVMLYVCVTCLVYTIVPVNCW